MSKVAAKKPGKAASVRAAAKKKPASSREMVTPKARTKTVRQTQNTMPPSAVGRGTSGMPPQAPHPGMMGDGTEEQNLNQLGVPEARITQEEVETAFQRSKPEAE
jgi:hypothetical protein